MGWGTYFDSLLVALHLIEHHLLIYPFSCRTGDIVKYLIDANPNALVIRNNAGGTPLHLSCCGAQSSSSIVEFLLKKHDEYNFQSDDLDLNGALK